MIRKAFLIHAKPGMAAEYEKVLKNFFMIALFALITLSCSNEMVIYVSSEGSDNNPGTIKEPVATLKKAVDMAVQMRSGSTGGQVTVFLREGVYRMEKGIRIKEEEGEAKPLLLISGYEDEEVVITGGESIDPDKITPVKDQELLARFAADARAEIRQVDLRALGISDFGELRNVGFARPYGNAWGELFINKEPMHLSRWPNRGMIPMGKVLEKGSVPRDEDFSNRGGVMMYDSSRVDKWAAEKDAWIAGYFMWPYADDMVKIAAIDTKKSTITTASATLYGYGNEKPWNKWYGVNILLELDEAGEYYIDRGNGILYFISGEDRIESMEFSMLEEPFFSLEGVADIAFRGIVFECSRGIGIAMDNTRNTTIERCTFRNLGSLAVTVGKGIEPFSDYRHDGTGKPISGIVGSLQQHMYANTAFNREGGNNNIITGCHFYNLGAGGVSLGGGDRLTLEAGNNVVENCLFHDVNRIEKSYRPAIELTGVGNQVRHCEIFNMPNQAILMQGNDHLIEYNYFHDVVLEAEDAGAIYYGRDPSERGIAIRYNYFENIPVKESHYTCAVYADACGSGLNVTGNVFYNAGKVNFLTVGGNDHTFTNNISIKGITGIFVCNAFYNLCADMAAPGGTFEKRLQAVGFDTLPYSARYPELPSYFSNTVHSRGNVAENNVFINMEEKVTYVDFGDDLYGEVVKAPEKEKGWIDLKGNLETDQDVGFVDWENRDFSLTPNSVIYERLPGFKEIPFHKIGLYETGLHTK